MVLFLGLIISILRGQNIDTTPTKLLVVLFLVLFISIPRSQSVDRSHVNLLMVLILGLIRLTPRGGRLTVEGCGFIMLA